MQSNTFSPGLLAMLELRLAGRCGRTDLPVRIAVSPHVHKVYHATEATARHNVHAGHRRSGDMLGIGAGPLVECPATNVTVGECLDLFRYWHRLQVIGADGPQHFPSGRRHLFQFP